MKIGIKIFIPKFEFEYELDLVNDLKSLGITDAFDINKADFYNISNEQLLQIFQQLKVKKVVK